MKKNTHYQRKECYKNFWKYAKKVLDDEDYSKIEPTFNKETADSFFANTYSSKSATFERPHWMKPTVTPIVPLIIDEITNEEIQVVITRSKAGSSPSPIDQIPYKVLKNCPSLLPALHHLYNTCWFSKSVPSQWKVGVMHLLGKKAAKSNPEAPTSFRPIALTSCIGKVYTSILKGRWLHYMTTNRYVDTNIQKAFIDGISGCTEHHVKLLAMIKEARRKHKSLAVCWIDIANAYGSVHHDLIRFSLEHYHAPPHMVEVVANLYSNLTGIAQTKQWTTEPFLMQIGVYQGDPLSVVIFNTVMNTLVETICQSNHLGFSLTNSSHRCNLLQYADDTCLTTNSPAACQALLDTTSRWLIWSGLKAKVPKCCSIAIHASSGEPFHPKLHLHGEEIPSITPESYFKFLGAPIVLHDASKFGKQHIIQKMEILLNHIDVTLVTRQQKLRLYKEALCPRLLWDISITDLPISWVEKNLQTLGTRFLKKWSGLAKCAGTSKLYLPREAGGLQLPSIVTIYKKLKSAKAATLMTSRDPMVRHLATQETQAEVVSRRQVFKPFHQVVQTMQKDPGATRKQIIHNVKKKIDAEDAEKHTNHSRSLVRQGQTTRQFHGDRAAELWSSVIPSLPEQIFKFALNSVTDTLPHNENLYQWAKLPSPTCKLCPERQTLLHTLNGCKPALELRRYNQRHDSILEIIYLFLKQYQPEGARITVDLPEYQYSFPQHIVTTDTRPDIVIWDDTSKAIHLVELTVPFETGFVEAQERKRTKYQPLLEECQKSGFTASLITIEVGSRGFLNTDSFNQLYQLIKSNKSPRTDFEKKIVRTCLICSFDIWCKRNWKDTKLCI